MSKVLVTESHLSNIAEAIRGKNGASTTYRPGDMAAAIQAIPTGITPTGTKLITTNGIQDVTQYANVDVNVSTGGNIIYGPNNPTAAQGNDGDVFFKYDIYSGYDSLLPTNDHNLNNWTKNAAAFPEFDNFYANDIDENTLIHTGGNGYERIFVPIPIEQNTDYIFGLKYYSPTGIYRGYSGQLNIKASFASASTMSSSSALSSYEAMTNLSISAESNYSDYSLTFNSGSNTNVYLVIDLNITDGRQGTMKFKNIMFYRVGEPPVEFNEKVISNAYIKKSGTWTNAIGMVVD